MHVHSPQDCPLLESMKLLPCQACWYGMFGMTNLENPYDRCLPAELPQQFLHDFVSSEGQDSFGPSYAFEICYQTFKMYLRVEVEDWLVTCGHEI